MRVGYILSRFPALSELWIVHEMDAVEARGHRIELFPLFGSDRQEAVHESARRWSNRVRRSTTRRVCVSFGFWLRRRPLRLLVTIGAAGAYIRRPIVFIKAMATIVIAIDHARAMQRDEISHVHAHFGTYPALAAWVVHRLLDIPYGFTVHAHDLYVHTLHLARKVRDAEYVVAISEYNRGLIQGLGEPTPVELIHCGVDPSTIDYRDRPLPHTTPRALCVAGLHPKKGHRFLFEALLHPGLDSLTLRLVGDGPEWRSLARQVAELGITERVEFLGALTHPRVLEQLAEADLFVLPSIVAEDGDTEGIPVALMEAMAAGVPVVATAVSGVPELVRDGVTGVTVTPGAPDALAVALGRVLSDWDGARERARRAREMVETEFDVRRSAGTLAELWTTGKSDA
jgi:glycosyltransferase involved in cell wall biosynthesis